MKRYFKQSEHLSHLVLLLAASKIGLQAAEQSYNASPASKSAAPQSSPSLVNQWLQEQNPAFQAWDIGGQFRMRYEDRENAGAFPSRDFIRSGQVNSDDYLLFREKLHIGYTPATWVKFYVEGRNSTAKWDKREPSPEADSFDLQQAYAQFGDLKQFPLMLKVGRQELLYGDERFIGISDWSNVGRVFDAAKLRYQNETLWVDLFSGRVVLPWDDHFNVVNDYDWFSGIYASSRKLVPWQETELYFLSRNVAPGSPNALAPGLGGSAARDVYTIGGRVKSLPGKLKAWDYSAELAGQVGSVNSGGVRRDLQAFAADVTAGYTWTNLFGLPRFGLGYTYASGDSDPTDDKSETFEGLVGTNHRFYGVMDLWGLRNISAPRVSASIKPAKKLNVALDYHVLFLANGHDFFYPESGSGRNANGYGRNPQFNKFVGSELDLVGTCNATSYLEVQFGYGHFFVGDYIRESVESVPANGGAVGADWFYAQVKFNF